MKRIRSSASRAKEIIHRYEGDEYTAFHSMRYAVLLNLLEQYVNRGSNTRILDIGPSNLTKMIGETFKLNVDTLGFDQDRKADTGEHYCFNLNDAQWQYRWRKDLPNYDVIVMAEVIEHLYTSPSLVLGFLKSILNPGGLIIVQTPNGLALPRRLRLLFGTHPYQLINENHLEPWHYREYSEKELRSYAKKLNLTIGDCILSNYFDGRYVSHLGNMRPRFVGTLTNAIYEYLPRNMRLGITISMMTSP